MFDQHFVGMRTKSSQLFMRRKRYWYSRRHWRSGRWYPWETIKALRYPHFVNPPAKSIEEMFERLDNYKPPLWSKFGKHQDTDGLEIIRCRMMAIRQRPNRLKK